MKLLAALLVSLCLGAAFAAEPAAGAGTFGAHGFIEYVAGDLPLIIAAPHGGRLKPAEIPDRTSGVVDIDANTQELARAIASVVHAETGRHVHLILCHLHRSKLDANRDLAEAAQGSALAEHAWQEHHAFISQACASAVKHFGVAFLIDLHGHGHADSRLELGYLHDSLDLADCEEALNQSTFINAGSLRWIAQRSTLSYTELLRGPRSLGALLEREGFHATPSPRMPVPTGPFFRGGYTIQHHCKAALSITGLQIEAHRPRLRDTDENRLAFSRALVKSLAAYFPLHLGIRLDEPRRLIEAQ
ncbi:hypothetical protein [Prosthecobacter sp.]|uniref:hypothetical protein n=1 Tax=Prosthecobacter sp. TaxID=1965333 RepID=UPI003783412D